MRSKKEIRKAIDAILSQAACLQEEMEAANSRRMVRCLGFNGDSGCKKLTLISKLVYLQTYWYESPHGCTGGDNWWTGEGQFVCLKCGELNRLHSRPDIMKLDGYFAKIEKVYDRD